MKILEVYQCPFCGFDIKHGVSFCEYCRSKIAWASQYEGLTEEYPVLVLANVDPPKEARKE